MKKDKKLLMSFLLNVLLIATVLILMLNYNTFGNFKKIITSSAAGFDASPYYLTKVSVFDDSQREEQPIIFLGDSLTDINDWSDIRTKKSIINMGINSDTTEGVLNRLDIVIRNNPSKIFLLIGTNDIAKGLGTDEIISNYEQIVTILKKELPNTELIIQSVFPVNNLLHEEYYGSKINNSNTVKLNKKLQNLASRNEATFINLYDKLLSENNELNKDYTVDGLHLNNEGYSVWESEINKYVK